MAAIAQVIHEEKQLVAQNGSAQRAAKAALGVGISGNDRSGEFIYPGIRVEVVVFNRAIGRAVEVAAP